jgi:hypothetical protein
VQLLLTAKATVIMNSQSLVSKLHDVSVVFDGVRVVEAKMLYDSRL